MRFIYDSVEMQMNKEVMRCTGCSSCLQTGTTENQHSGLLHLWEKQWEEPTCIKLQKAAQVTIVNLKKIK